MKRQRWKTGKHGRQTFSVSSGGEAEALMVSSEDPRPGLAPTPPGLRPAAPGLQVLRAALLSLHCPGSVFCLLASLAF